MRARLVLLFFAASLAHCTSTDEPTKPAGPVCGYHDECGTGKVCFEGQCKATQSCVERRNCRNVPVCAGDQCFCDQDTNRCLPACTSDEACPADGHCLDGVCERYPVDYTTWPVPTSGARGELKVGIAAVPLDFPMGVSLAGFGSRLGPRTPYQDSLGGSNAWFERPDVRAMAVDDGKEMFVLLRIPTCWSTDFMLSRTAEKVADRTGVNLLNRIVSSATHSHSSPARYWHMVVGLGFGFFGYGEFSREVFERMTDSFADAIELALMDLQPARFGYTMLEDFDPDNKIHRDRRQQNNNLAGDNGKDGRMLLMRVDNAQGEPMAILSNFGVHGTLFDFDSPVITGDVGAGVEREMSRLASEKYNRPVMGFFIQGNAGDISPGGDDKQHNDFERVQVLGRRVWDVVQEPFDSMSTKSDIQVGIYGGRIPINHEILGYGDGAFFDSDVSCEATPDYFRYGAFQCVEGTTKDDDPATKFTDGDLNCVFSLECLTGGYPVPQFTKTRLSALRLGTLALVTMPGEPLSQFGRDISDRVLDVVDGVTDAAVLGYSQDHHFYLLNEDDWLQGGYEPSRDIWGWKLAPYLADNSVKIAAELSKEPEDRTWDDGNLKPMYWPIDPQEEARIPLTESPAPTTVVLEIPETVQRLDEITFGWQGGHPGGDLPHVSLQREDGGSFVPVTLPGGLPYGDSGFRMMVRYLGDCNRSQCQDHQWQVRWQDGRDFPVGNYRLLVEGKAWNGTANMPYELTSRTFALAPSTKLHIESITIQGDQLRGVIIDPAMVRLVEDGEGLKAESNALYLRSMDVPAHLGAPLATGMVLSAQGTISAASISGSSAIAQEELQRRRLTGYAADGSATWAADRVRPTSTFSVQVAGLDTLPAGDHWLELTLTDPLGNSGTITATITK